MDTFPTAAITESLERALAQKAQQGYRYGHIIDASKDPRRRKLEDMAEYRNALPARSSTSALDLRANCEPPDHTVQEGLASPDPPGKAAPLAKTAEPTLRSVNIVNTNTELRSQKREGSTAGNDPSSFGPRRATTAIERDRNIHTQGSHARAAPSVLKKPGNSRGPTWSVSSEEYQKLFLQAQLSKPAQYGRAMPPIPYDIERAVLAMSLRASNTSPGRSYSHQEISYAVRSMQEMGRSRPRTDFLQSAAPKPIGPRRSSQVVDTVSRLLEDTKGGVEYVKGVGVMRLEAEDASTGGAPRNYQNESRENHDEKISESNEERSFTVQHISTEHMDFDNVEIRWTAQTNSFLWYKDQQILEELQAISAQSIENVAYHLEEQCFHLELRPRDSPELIRSFTELLLVMERPPRDFMMLRSLFETSISAMRVHRADRTYFINKAQEFQHLREMSRLSLSIPMESKLSVESSESHHPVQEAKNLPVSLSEDLDPSVNDAAKLGPNLDIASEVDVVSEIDIASAVDVTSEVAMQETTAKREAAAAIKPCPVLLYNSREPVSVGDLVIRLRNEEDMKDGANKSDKLDVYDGPWVVRELPFSSATTTSDLFEDDVDVIERATLNAISDSQKASEARDMLMHKIQQKLVKLDFPAASKAEPWTRVGHLRPVYATPEEAASNDARTWHRQPQEADARVIVNIDTAPDTDSGLEGPTGVARIQKGAYVNVQYVSSEATEENTWEVEKLRGKNLWRYSLGAYEDPMTDCTDSMILRYLGHEKGYVKEDELLVVKYLVHWAGWPSEDDTWEVGNNNIPRPLMEQYDATLGDFVDEGLAVTRAIVDLTRVYKSPKKTKKKPKAASVKSRKRKSAAGKVIVVDSDTEVTQQETSGRAKRRALASSIKAARQPETDTIILKAYRGRNADDSYADEG